MSTKITHPGGVFLKNGLEVYAVTGSNGQSELWSTDQVDTTQLTHVINAYGGLQPMNFLALPNGKEVFEGRDNSGEWQLWGTDAVTAHAFTSIRNASGGLDPSDFFALGNGREIFIGLDSAGRAQIWGTDGVTATALTNVSTRNSVTQNIQGITPSSINFTRQANGTATFYGYGNNGALMHYVTDGTSSGTHTF